MEHNGYKPGYIYVLRSGPYYKIGYADNVEQRLRTVGSSVKPDDLTDPIELLFSFQTTSKLIAERALHEFFRQTRVKGEWFRLTDRQIGVLRMFVDEITVDEFVMRLHRLPQDVVLFTKEDIDFCKRFTLLFPLADGSDEITHDKLEEYIEHERAKRGRKDRARRYQSLISNLLDKMSVGDLEWLYESIMTRGVVADDEE